MPLYRDLMTKQGPVGVNWKHPIQKQKRDEKKSILDTYLESQNTLLQIQMLKEMANSLGSSSQCRPNASPMAPHPGLQYAECEFDWTIVRRIGREELDDKSSLLDNLLNASIQMNTHII